jgi:ribosomal-protein-alanine N-acetyltransferase
MTSLSISIPKIETQRLILRQALATDLQDWANNIFAVPKVIQYMPKRDMTPLQRAERAFNNYNRLWEEHGIGGWIITNKQDGRFIGSIEIEYLDETCEYELGYCMGKDHWGKGIMTEAARAVVRFGFERAKLDRIIAVVIPENIASWRVLEHIGFVYEKKAVYYDLDVVYYAIMRDQFQPDNSFYRLYGPNW